MANSAAAFGFIPVRTIDGTGNTATVRLRKSSATGDDARIAIGDPVRLTNGTVEKLLTTDVSAAAGTYYGVVAGINTSTGRPKDAFSEVGSVSTTAQSTDTFDVLIQDNLVFRVASDLDAQTLTSAEGFIGSVANVVHTAYTTQDGTLGKSTARITFGVGLSATAPFKVIGVSRTVDDTNNVIFEVVGNNTVLKNGKV